MEWKKTQNQALIGCLLCLFWVACSGSDGDHAERFHIFDYNEATERYELVEADIETLSDPRRVDGEIVYMRGDGRIVIGTADPGTREGFEDSLRIEDDRAPRVDFEVNNGVLTAWDYHGLLMLTLYHHFEQAAFYFEQIGIDRDVVGKVAVHYAPRLELIIPFNLLTDNAAYAFTMDAFLLPNQSRLSGLPFAVNRGVIVHEYSHAVFNRLVHGGARAPDYLLQPWSDQAINRMRAIDEGVADIFGALAVGDSDFIAPSIVEQDFGIDRDVAEERFYTSSMRSREHGDPNQYDPYALGSVIASAVWALRPMIDDTTLGQSVVNALRDFGSVGSSFDVDDFFEALYANLPQDIRSQACSIFRDRLTAISGQLQCS